MQYIYEHWTVNTHDDGGGGNGDMVVNGKYRLVVKVYLCVVNHKHASGPDFPLGRIRRNTASWLDCIILCVPLCKWIHLHFVHTSDERIGLFFCLCLMFSHIFALICACIVPIWFAVHSHKWSNEKRAIVSFRSFIRFGELYATEASWEKFLLLCFGRWNCTTQCICSQV